MIKPMPAKEIWDLLVGIKYVFSLEEGIISGGFGEALEARASDTGIRIRCYCFRCKKSYRQGYVSERTAQVLRS